MLRQGSNWASRQGLTDLCRTQIRSYRCSNGGDPSQYRLGIFDETIAGTVGGMLSAWNQPFEVMRIDAQARGARGLPSRNVFQTAGAIISENGVAGLFQGIIPRMGLCVGQTLFMITVPYILKEKGFM